MTARPFSLKPLMFETFACTMAMTSFVALAGPIGRELGLVPWQVGAAVTAGGIAWMSLARPWGAASDRRGRRPVLLAGLGGFALCYGGLCLFVALALETALPPLAAFAGLVLWRGLTGAFYAAVPATGAALVADHTPPERRAAAMASLGMANGSAMVIGPAFAGLLAPHGLGLPLHAVAVLPLLALAVLWRTLPRDGRHVPPPPGPPLAWTDRRLRRPMAVAFIGMFSVAVAQICVGFYAIDRLGLTPGEGARVAGIALACVGGALTLSQVMVRRLGWPPIRFIRLGASIAAIGFAAVALADAAPLLWACYFVAAAGMGLVWPSITALAANAVERHEQGAAAGTVAAAQGLGSILGPLAGALLYGLAPVVPYLLVAAVLALLARYTIQR